MKEITIGLDIGTQFCYAGYWNYDEQKFIQLNVRDDVVVADSDFVKNNGIPTDVAVTKKGDFIFGIEVEKKKLHAAENKSASEFYFMPEGNSIKSLLRAQFQDDEPDRPIDFKNLDDIKFRQEETDRPKIIDSYNPQNGVFYKFIEYIQKQIKSCLDCKFGEDGYKIDQVVFAYPGPEEKKGDSYKKEVQRIIKEVFGLSVEPQYITEAQVAAACLSNELKYSCNLCFVDIGAGTTDISIMQKTDEGYQEVYEGTRTVPFGGKIIDRELFTDEKLLTILSAKAILDHKKYLLNSGVGQEIKGLRNYCRSATVVEEKVKQVSINNWFRLTDALNSAKTELDSLGGDYSVILIGGTGRIPFVSTEVKAIFGEEKVVALSSESDAKKLGITDANFISYSAATLRKLNVGPGSKTIVVPERIRGKAIALLDRNHYFHIVADGTKAQAKINTYKTPISWHDVYTRTGERCEFFTIDDFYLIAPPEGERKFSKEVYKESEITEKNKYIITDGEVTKETLYQSDGEGIIDYYIGTAFQAKLGGKEWGKIFIYVWDDTIAKNCYPPEGKAEIAYGNFERDIENNLYGKPTEKPAQTQPQPQTQPQTQPRTQPQPQPVYTEPPERPTYTQPQPVKPMKGRKKAACLRALSILGFIASAVLICLGLCFTYLPDIHTLKYWAITATGFFCVFIEIITVTYQCAKHGFNFKSWFE